MRHSSLIRFLEGSLSESDDTPGNVEQPPRNSRSLAKADRRQQYERTQSMDRGGAGGGGGKEKPSAVFYLEDVKVQVIIFIFPV